MDKGVRKTANEVKEEEEKGLIDWKRGKDEGKEKSGNDTWNDKVKGFLAKVSQEAKLKR